MLDRFATDDRGVDLVEYGLLIAIFAIGLVLIFPAIHARMQSAFDQWGTNINALWIPDDPL